MQWMSSVLVFLVIYLYSFNLINAVQIDENADHSQELNDDEDHGMHTLLTILMLVIQTLVAIFTTLGLVIVCKDYFIHSLDRVCEGEMLCFFLCHER